MPEISMWELIGVQNVFETLWSMVRDPLFILIAMTMFWPFGRTVTGDSRFRLNQTCRTACIAL